MRNSGDYVESTEDVDAFYDGSLDCLRRQALRDYEADDYSRMCYLQSVKELGDVRKDLYKKLKASPSRLSSPEIIVDSWFDETPGVAEVSPKKKVVKKKATKKAKKKKNA